MTHSLVVFALQESPILPEHKVGTTDWGLTAVPGDCIFLSGKSWDSRHLRLLHNALGEEPQQLTDEFIKALLLRDLRIVREDYPDVWEVLNTFLNSDDERLIGSIYMAADKAENSEPVSSVTLPISA